MQRGYDQIIHDVALQNLPVRFVIDRAGLTGEDGPTHHGIFDVAFLRIIPNVEVCNTFTKSSIDCVLDISKTLTKPLFIRLPKENIVTDFLSNIEYQPYKLTVIRNETSKKLLIASGRILAIVCDIEKYSDYTIIDPYFFKPLDLEILSYIKKSDFVEIIDENSQGGLASIILEECVKSGISTGNIVVKIIPDAFISHGKNSILFTKECGLF